MEQNQEEVADGKGFRDNQPIDQYLTKQKKKKKLSKRAKMKKLHEARKLNANKIQPSSSVATVTQRLLSQMTR